LEKPLQRFCTRSGAESLYLGLPLLLSGLPIDLGQWLPVGRRLSHGPLLGAKTPMLDPDEI
jgi:hypothetical protein